MQQLVSWQCFIFQLNLEDDPALLLKSDQFIESGEKNAREDVGSFYYLINVITSYYKRSPTLLLAFAKTIPSLGFWVFTMPQY